MSFGEMLSIAKLKFSNPDFDLLQGGRDQKQEMVMNVSYNERSRRKFQLFRNEARNSFDNRPRPKSTIGTRLKNIFVRPYNSWDAPGSMAIGLSNEDLIRFCESQEGGQFEKVFYGDNTERRMGVICQQDGSFGLQYPFGFGYDSAKKSYEHSLGNVCETIFEKRGLRNVDNKFYSRVRYVFKKNRTPTCQMSFRE